MQANVRVRLGTTQRYSTQKKKRKILTVLGIDKPGLLLL